MRSNMVAERLNIMGSIRDALSLNAKGLKYHASSDACPDVHPVNQISTAVIAQSTN